MSASPTRSQGLEATIGIERDGFSLELDLRIEAGTTLALLGPNGAGKSTVVEALAGLTPLDRGRIELAGRTLDEPGSATFVAPEDRAIGIVFQDYLLFEHLSVVDNVAFPVRHRHAGRGRRRRAAHQAVEPLLEALDLVELADQRPSQLSGGQAQRVALARALAGQPSCLILDEPLAAVDASTRVQLRRLLATHLQRFAGPRLLITHDPVEAFTLATELAVVENGRLVQTGTADELRRHPATPWVADLAGTNLLSGVAEASIVTVDGLDVDLTTASDVVGPVDAIVDPRAVSLHLERPEGSPRNTFPSTIEWIEDHGRTSRVRLGPPLPLTVDITSSSARALALAPGRPVWAAIKATEIVVRAR